MTRIWAIERNAGRAGWVVTNDVSLKLAAYRTEDEARRALRNGECGYYPKGMLRVRRYGRSRGRP